MPDGYDDETRNVLRFLQGLKWDYKKTFEAIQEHAQWRSTVNVTDETPFLAHLNQGMLYALRRDRSERPIIVVNVRKVIESKIEIEPLMQTVDFFTNYVVERAMVPGKIECWTCIFDMSNVPLTSLPRKHL